MEYMLAVAMLLSKRMKSAHTAQRTAKLQMLHAAVLWNIYKAKWYGVAYKYMRRMLHSSRGRAGILPRIRRRRRKKNELGSRRAHRFSRGVIKENCLLTEGIRVCACARAGGNATSAGQISPWDLIQLYLIQMWISAREPFFPPYTIIKKIFKRRI